MKRRKLAVGFAAACVTLVFPSKRKDGPTQHLQITPRKDGGTKYGVEYQKRNKTHEDSKRSRIYRPKAFGTVRGD